MPNADPYFNRIPMRITVKGEKKNKDDIWKDFETQLEFYEFRTKISDETVFLVSSLTTKFLVLLNKHKSVIIVKDTCNSHV